MSLMQQLQNLAGEWSTVDIAVDQTPACINDHATLTHRQVQMCSKVLVAVIMAEACASHALSR